MQELGFWFINDVIWHKSHDTFSTLLQESWVLNIKKQCEEQGIAFFFKQWGTYGNDGIKRNKKQNGAMLQGKMYRAYPTSKSLDKIFLQS